MVRYQNFPCAIDSIGSLQSAPPLAPPPANTTSPSSVSSQASPTAIPVAVAATGKPSVAKEPRVGMTTEEVTAIWGEPEDVIQDELREGRIEIWRYGDGRSVQFSNKHRVLVVDR